MGNLRDRAEAEQKEHHKKLHEDHREREERRKREHAERLQPVVDYLTEWSGEEVTAEMLEPAPTPGMGPARWDITIDGFKLRVEAVGKRPQNTDIAIEQLMENGKWRQVWQPKELLDSEPVEIP